MTIRASTMLSNHEIAQAIVDWATLHKRIPEKATILKDGIQMQVDAADPTNIHAVVWYEVGESPGALI